MVNLNSNPGVFIVDDLHSPLWRSAVQGSSENNIKVIPALEYSCAYRLAKTLGNLKPQFIVFSWRIAFDAIINNFICRNILKQFNPSIYLLIPDFQNALEFNSEEQRRLTLADGVFVTNQKLYDIYLTRYSANNIRLFYDCPALQDIEIVKNFNLSKIPNKVLWVGNSKWGHRIGLVDHKRLFSLAIPAMKLAKSINEAIDFIIIDSSKSALSNLDTLIEISTSSCLIVTSVSEGTSLPLLEAIALGTSVVTVDVGVAKEFLIGELESQIVEPDSMTLCLKVIETLQVQHEQGPLLRDVWLNFLEKMQITRDFNNLTKFKDGSWRNSNNILRIKKEFSWFIRWLKKYIKID